MLSNNPLFSTQEKQNKVIGLSKEKTSVLEKIRATFVLKHCQELEDVLLLTRDQVHQGGRLITHPLAGSLKPWENPYRTIGIRSGSDLDFASLEIIESAIKKYEQFFSQQKLNSSQNLTPETRRDFSLIDFSLIYAGFKNCNGSDL